MGKIYRSDGIVKWGGRRAAKTHGSNGRSMITIVLSLDPLETIHATRGRNKIARSHFENCAHTSETDPELWRRVVRIEDHIF